MNMKTKNLRTPSVDPRGKGLNSPQSWASVGASHKQTYQETIRKEKEQEELREANQRVGEVYERRDIKGELERIERIERIQKKEAEERAREQRERNKRKSDIVALLEARNYHIVSDDNFCIVEEWVDIALSIGFETVGGIAIGHRQSGLFFVQAIQRMDRG